MGWATTMGRLVEVLESQRLIGERRSDDPRIIENRPPRMAPFDASNFDALSRQDQLGSMISEFRNSAASLPQQFDGVNVDIDTLAWYQPAHFYPSNPGIYVLASGVQKLSAYLLASLPQKLQDELIDEEVQAIMKYAWRLLVAHEIVHHSVEVAITGMELLSEKPLYEDGRRDREIRRREEALATSRMLKQRFVGSTEGNSKEITTHLNGVNPLWLSAMPDEYQEGRRFVSASAFAKERSSLRNAYLGRTSGAIDLRGLVEFPSSVSDLSDHTFLVWYESDSDAFSAAMSRVTLNCKEAIKILEKNGFNEVRGGKHRNMKSEVGGTKIAVPCHGGKDLSMKVVGHIANALGVTVSQLARM